MKTSLRIAAKCLILLLATIAIQCSEECTVTNTYYYTEPIYMSLQELRTSVIGEEPRDLVNAGRIYFKDDFLYINEKNEGIHVIDNRNPSNPVYRSFITIPGNYDLAIYGNTLYADSYIDLVAIDISTPGQEHEVARYKDMFSYYSTMRFSVNPELGVIRDVTIGKEVTVSDDCSGTWQGAGWRYYQEGVLMSSDAYYALSSSSGGSKGNVTPGNPTGNSAGIGGSMARFTIASDHLYVLDNYKLSVVDVTTPSEINLKNSIQINSDVETIFPYNQNLFLGSQTGMHIYDISTADDPKKISTFSHLKSCDPVVVEGKYAYVTLRSETMCNGIINELQVIDVSDLRAPRHLNTYQMTNPHGLGIDNNTLFICDGDDGLKIYDATDKGKIADNMKAHYKDIQAFDVIPFDDVAMMIGEDGLYQYDYSDMQNIRLLSRMEFKLNH
jgi:hypothetical protein